MAVRITEINIFISQTIDCDLLAVVDESFTFQYSFYFNDGGLKENMEITFNSSAMLLSKLHSCIF